MGFLHDSHVAYPRFPNPLTGAGELARKAPEDAMPQARRTIEVNESEFAQKDAELARALAETEAKADRAESS